MANFFDDTLEDNKEPTTIPGNFFEDTLDEPTAKLPTKNELKTTTQNVERTWGDTASDAWGYAKDAGMMADSAMRGAANALTFGWADEMAAGAGAATGIGGDFGDYSGNVQDQRAEDTERWEKYPVSTGVGTVAGALAVPGGALKSGAGLGANALRAGVSGAGAGALGGAGAAESIEDIPQAVRDGAMMGALTGGVGGAGANLLGRAASGVGNMAGNRINDLASSRFGSSILGRTGESFDGSVGNAINKLEGFSPRLADMADSAYDSIGGGKGAAARAGLMGADLAGLGGAGTSAVASEAALKLGGGAAQGLGNLAMNNAARVGNIAGQQAGFDPAAEAMRNPQSILERTAGTKYEYPLMEAAGRGRDALIAQVHVLSQTDPNFRSIFE